MVSTSKILTVSYGTFSCTLEGFDDSFETMKAIAEYFRDLASNDRYFGAEPPTPDAEMLARIAEREIARRVEAHEAEGRIVLRAAERTAPQPDPHARPAPAIAEDGPQKAAEEPAAREAADLSASLTAPFPGRIDEAGTETAEPEMADIAEPEVADIAEPEMAEPEEERAETEDTAEMAEPEIAEAAAEAVEVSAEEPDIAPAKAGTPEEMEEPETLEAALDMAEEAPAEADAPELAEEPEISPLAAEAEPLADAPETAAEDEPEPAFDPAALVAEAIVDDTADTGDVEAEQEAEAQPDEAPEILEEDEAAEPEAIASPEPTDEEEDSVAARLRRIRSVVAQSAGTYGSDDYLEDEHAQEFLERTAAELDATLAEDETAEMAQPQSGTKAEDPLIGLAERLADDRADAEDAQDEDDEDDLAAELSEDTLAQLLADAMPAGTEPEPPLVLTGAEQVETESEPKRPLRARVVKMKRSEFEAAIAEGRIEEDFGDEDESFDLTAEFEDDEDFGDDEAILSPEDEAELQRELAEVEAELSGGADVPAAPSGPAAEDVAADDLADQELADTHADAAFDENEEDWPAPEQEAPEAPRAEEIAAEAPEEEDEDDADMRRGAARLQRAGAESDATRIFDEADTHFEAPDSSRRRNAIQHLRAAVAATKAEKRAGSRLEREADEEPYRSDLASVVRPRRPEPPAAEGSARSRRPAEDRPAPLKLVAEQRVDTPREPVRPRRVSALMGEAAVGTSNGGFSDYADRIGAHTLPELLEAAAAYMADVEGRQQFSRPMLMGKLKEVERESFSREDGLRSFGHLLRQGKLQKLKGGRFSVTDQTEFRSKRQAG